jgi:hypothetical protein
MLTCLLRTYLPEEFLWKVFNSMAEVAEIMEDGRYKDINSGNFSHDPYVLIHSDIKPINGKSPSRFDFCASETFGRLVLVGVDAGHWHHMLGSSTLFRLHKFFGRELSNLGDLSFPWIQHRS